MNLGAFHQSNRRAAPRSNLGRINKAFIKTWIEYGLAATPVVDVLTKNTQTLLTKNYTNLQK